MFYRVIIVSLFLSLSVSLFGMEIKSADADTAQYLKNPNYHQQIAMYDMYKTKQANIVMLGNSLTHGANWNQLLGRENVVEMGIPSDLVEGMLNRLEYVYNLKPKVVFILGGINDIYSWIPLETIMVNYIQILKNLEIRGIKPVVQSVVYAGEKWPNSADRNQQVEKFNRMLKQYARKNNIKYIDLNKSMSENKFLKDELTIDALHFNAKGFKVWAREIEKVLQKEGL